MPLTNTLSKMYLAMSFLIYLTPVESFGQVVLGSSKYQLKVYEIEVEKAKIDAIRNSGSSFVEPYGDPAELATLLAVSYYPKLEGNTIRIKYKKNVRYPITASWAAGNIFKSRKKHTYVLLLSTKSFVNHISLNKQVGVIGHEMAHFDYYKKHSSIHMLWWGLKYLVSKKYSYRFESDADYQAINHGLVWQLLEISYYISRVEVESYMRQSGLYDF